MNNLVRYSVENPNPEALKGKYGYEGLQKFSVTVIKNLVFVVAYKGAKINGYKLPEVFDGFVTLSDGSTVPVNDSTLTLDLAEGVSASGILKLVKDN